MIAEALAPSRMPVPRLPIATRPIAPALVHRGVQVHSGRMKAALVEFGVLELAGHRYTCDVVIDGGRVTRRNKAPSKTLRGGFGHTPLSAAEDIPWGGGRLIVGTGADGALPITSDLVAEARRRGITIEALPTPKACRLLAGLKRRDVHAVLHVTC